MSRHPIQRLHLAPITFGRSSIDHHSLGRIQIGQHLIHPNQQRFIHSCREGPFPQRWHQLINRPAFRPPLRPTSIQQRHSFKSDPPRHPPQPGRILSPDVIVSDHTGFLRYPMLG